MSRQLAKEIAQGKHVPDILDCLAQLSSDEVPTPPWLANEMLDLLPEHVWSDPTLKWLDPGVKSGVFLREAAKRLLVGLKEWEPDFNKRKDHIYREMLYGCAITPLTGMIARRSVYCSRDASSDESIVKFDNSEGNIKYIPTDHIHNKGNCIICGASEKDDNLRQHAYFFIHTKEITTEREMMKFDVIVGNPPYQISMYNDNGDRTANILPLYHLFVNNAIKTSKRYVCMITPSRWFAGGKGLDDFRKSMINNRSISHIVDYLDSADCFPGVAISGGVSYFLIDSEYDGDCDFTVISNKEILSHSVRDLRDGDGVIVRDNLAASILNKVRKFRIETLDNFVSTQDPFGQKLKTNYKFSVDKPFKNSIPLIYNSRVGYISRNDLDRNQDKVDLYKVLIPKAGDQRPPPNSNVLGEPIVLAPGSACTQSYLLAGVFDNPHETENYAHYITTKFVRFLVLQRKTTQDVKPDKFKFVPFMDMSRRWTDEDLYSYFQLGNDEINYIEECIRPRECNWSLNSPIPSSHLPGGKKYKAHKNNAEVDSE